MSPADHDAAANAEALKLHLRLVTVGGVTYRVVAPRPSTTARFSTNYYHGTWHILAGRGGAALLGRLLWGLAFQRQPDTLIVIDRAHLAPTPFEGDRADPIALLPAGLTRFDVDHLTALRRRLPAAPTSTIRWHTFGLAAALARDPVGPRRPTRDEEAREQMSRAGGMVCFTAPPAILRATAVEIYQARQTRCMTYVPLANHLRSCWQPDGEVQVFPTFDEDVAAAEVARREVLGAAAAARLAGDERERVWHRRDRVLARRRVARSP